MHIVQLAWEIYYNHETKFMNDVVSITTVIVSHKWQIYIRIQKLNSFKCVLTLAVIAVRYWWFIHE